MVSLGAAQSLGLTPLTSLGLLPVWPHVCGMGIYILGCCRDREPPGLLVLILCPLQGEVGEPGGAGICGLDGEQVQHRELCPHPDGLLQPPPQFPVPRMGKDGRRLLIL